MFGYIVIDHRDRHQNDDTFRNQDRHQSIKRHVTINKCTLARTDVIANGNANGWKNKCFTTTNIQLHVPLYTYYCDRLRSVRCRGV